MEPSSLRTPAEPGARAGSAAVPPPAKKQRTDDPTPLSEGAAAAAPPASGDGQELTRGNGAKMKKKRKTFIYGNYDAYYGYRSGPRGAPEQRDPRLALLQRAWFEGRRVLDIGCNSGVITRHGAGRHSLCSRATMAFIARASWHRAAVSTSASSL